MLKYMLLIDDDEEKHDFFQWAIQKYNSRFRLITAVSGKEGVHIFRKVKPAITFINFQLGDMDGLRCLKKIKSFKNTTGWPVYLYYVHANENLFKAAEKTGASGCIASTDTENGLQSFLYKTLTAE